MTPGLKILIFPYKFTTVDSNPIIDLPPSKINFILFPNSSFTSEAFIGLTFVDKLALGIARGNLNRFSYFLIVVFLGNLTAILFKLAFARVEILDTFFFRSIYVNGPGENLL